MSSAPVIITSDIDWAPDFMIRPMLDALEAAGVRSTWFLTHPSEQGQRIVDSPLCEAGIHPNFFPGSTQGDTPEAAIAYCRKLAPDARVVRTHGLMQSSGLLGQLAGEGRMAIDCSLFLHRAQQVEPIRFDYASAQMVRYPYVWEDDVEMDIADPCWELEAICARTSGAYVMLDFHPVHVYLNQPTMHAYQELKSRCKLSDATPDDVAPFVRSVEEAGPGSLFHQAIAHIGAGNGNLTVSELAEQIPLNS